MLVYLLQVYVLLTALLSQRPVNACSRGWFGQSCKYMCHCALSTTCDYKTGECPGNSPCSSPYFGPGCQFVDRVRRWSHQSTPSFLSDADDSTCNPNSADTTLELYLDSAHPMSFIRIVVNDNTNLHNFTTTLNGQPCPSESHFQVADKVVDVTCDIMIHLNALQINGPIAGSICSIYISQGRNVALLQDTYQDSVYQRGRSINAVDGNIDPDFGNGHCSHTDNKVSSSAIWILTFNRPHILYTALIYNRNEFRYRLIGVKTETFSANWTLVVSNVDPSTSVWNTYVVPLLSLEPVIHVKITQSPTFTGADRVLTLCEVEIFGDAFCDNHTYGLFCQSPCRCNRTDRCHVVTGACTLGCLPGFYGFNCLSLCGVNCFQGICEWRSGNCLQCNPGYMGDKCITGCSPGYFGQNCRKICSKRCLKPCDPVDGKCVCKKEFTGEYCTECSPGYYGQNCTSKCSEGCADTCSNLTGSCRCKTQFIGLNCSVCSATFYGAGCSKKCSRNCLDRVCDHMSGMCSSCAPGYEGDNCETENGHSWMFMLLLVPFLLLLAFFVQRSEKEDSEEL